jgi:hypothetical protein
VAITAIAKFFLAPFVLTFHLLRAVFSPVFAVLGFFEDFVTFLFGQINGLYLFLADGGLLAAEARMTESWCGLCNGTRPCRESDSERIRKIQERIEKLQNGSEDE